MSVTRPIISGSWLAAQVAHRAGALSLLLTVAGAALMVVGRNPFPQLLAAGFGVACLALVSSCLSRRWGGDRGETAGLIGFSGAVLVVAGVAMVVSRLGLWGVVGWVQL